MSELSNHTTLMNIFLCLANKNRHCDPVLFNNHYTVETIELQFNKEDGKKIHVDIALKNPKVNNLFLLECKDGSLQEDQSDRYKTLKKTDIVTAHVTTLSGDFNFEVVYAGTDDKKDKLIEGIKKNSCDFPVIICDEDKIKLEHNTFNCEILQKIFSDEEGVKIPKPVPVFYYPFGADDSNAHILSWIGPTLIKFRGNTFQVEDILRETHQSIDYIDERSLGNLKSRLTKMLSELPRGNLTEFFDLPPQNNKFKLNDFGIKKFQTQLNKCVAEAEKEAPKFEQKNLSKYFE